MMMRDKEISMLLVEKFKKESARLKSWGTKTDDKAAMSFAMAVSDFVRAMMCDSRYRELKRIRKKGLGQDRKVIFEYIEERMKATKAMTTALKNFAIEKEGKREWKPKEKHKHHHKHHHRKHK